MSTQAFELTTAGDTGRAIAVRRKELGWTQQRAADAAGVSRKFLSEVEAGHPRAELEKLLQLIHALGLSLAARPAPVFPRGLTGLDPASRDYAQTFKTLLASKDFEFAIKQLSEYVTASLSAGRPLLGSDPELKSREWSTMLAALTGYVARRLGQPRPAWTSKAALDFPWFPEESYRPLAQRMKELTMNQSPPELTELNVFMRERSLQNV